LMKLDMPAHRFGPATFAHLRSHNSTAAPTHQLGTDAVGHRARVAARHQLLQSLRHVEPDVWHLLCKPSCKSCKRGGGGECRRLVVDESTVGTPTGSSAMSSTTGSSLLCSTSPWKTSASTCWERESARWVGGWLVAGRIRNKRESGAKQRRDNRNETGRAQGAARDRQA
jgi:hypothetical protein